MRKAGPFGGHWKDRHFVLYNSDHNYKLEYKEKLTDEKSKGTINLACLSCEPFDASARQINPFGVALVPHEWNKFGRTWHFACKNKEEEDEWLNTLRIAIWHAAPPAESDKVIMTAFNEALMYCARQEDAWGMRFYEESEADSLSKFIFYIIYRNYLEKIYRNMESMNNKDSIQSSTSTATMNSITKSAQAAWHSAKEEVLGFSSDLKYQIQALATSYIDTEAVLLLQLGEYADNHIGASLKRIITSLFPNTMGTLAGPIGLAVAATITGFNKYCTTNMMRPCAEAQSKTHMEKSLTELEANADRMTWQWGAQGPLTVVTHHVREILTLLKDVPAFKRGYTPMKCYFKVRDSCVNLYRGAVQRFVRLCIQQQHGASQSGSVDLEQIRATVIGEMIHDAFLIIKDVYFDIFGDCIRENPLWQSQIVSPLIAATKTLADQVADMPNLGDLFDFNRLIEKALNTTLRSTLAPLIDKATTNCINKANLAEQTKANLASALN